MRGGEMKLLEVNKLNAWFGNNHVVKNISLHFDDKSIHAIIGPSGCGKSTFLRCLNRIRGPQHALMERFV
jgi:phosphate transport system ATP-binding protein